jgi:hypothetical protein
MKADSRESDLQIAAGLNKSTAGQVLYKVKELIRIVRLKYEGDNRELKIHG